MSEVLKKFGRYFLLDRVAQGGMAEIYRARLASTSGPSRLLVIKRIQQGYGANAEFVEMFRSETQVTMGFNHPNVVQVYDFGEEQDQPYIAMEFVDGKNLRQFLQRFNEIKRMIGGISQRMLTLTLRGLERDGLVTRTVFAEVPPRVEYELTPLGLTLGGAFCGVWVWAADNLKGVEAARHKFDARARTR